MSLTLIPRLYRLVKDTYSEILAHVMDEKNGGLLDLGDLPLAAFDDDQRGMELGPRAEHHLHVVLLLDLDDVGRGGERRGARRRCELRRGAHYWQLEREDQWR